ncbi:putative Ser/Thr protein kinase [Salirhabdus euzebyi]|uniref:Putative Ser/Thr protein kinase n=1 Tax=Salirhabdus euzebyi TaxID=394506 RepID=A0A841Q599_9BACI|nr:protein kinase family protein [Salirhabdus euzebyi]MBB6453533.1 putative Ser/Thr protein kinase [Salirhabdus euzebyi]
MRSVVELVNDIKFTDTKLVKYPAELHLIGKGRSAAVFQLGSQQKAVKVFYPSFKHLAEKEVAIYQCLNSSAYYPEIFEVGPSYFVMELFTGLTLYECLNKGIEITPRMIEEVDHALEFAKSKGLNPSDIHLRNIILTESNEIKIIDVVRFTQDKTCYQWRDLKNAYLHYYQLKYFPKKYPKFLMELIIRLYRFRILPIHSK